MLWQKLGGMTTVASAPNALASHGWSPEHSGELYRPYLRCWCVARSAQSLPMRCRILAFLAVAASVVLADPSPALAQSPAEDAFHDATTWTVLIRTSVDEAFYEDEQGSFFGSGLLVDAKRGWILTNAHVASHSYSDIRIAFHEQKAVPAERLYVDPYLDLAIVTFDPKALPPGVKEPQLDCDRSPPVGHPVGAFGHPWGFRFTGTRGIASAVTSRLGPDMLQTDAPINAGNSGGPLISLETGRVVGINTATMRKDEAEGLSFAVPMSSACRVLDLLRSGGDPSPPARLVDFVVDENDQRTLVVVHSRLPAASVDLRTGDEILAAGTPERPILNESDLINALRGQLDAVSLAVRRGSSIVNVIGRWPAAPKVTEREGIWISGAMFAHSDPKVNRYITGSPPLMVHHVEPGSVAESLEVEPFDFLLAADGKPVDSIGTLELLARQANEGERALELTLMRLAADEQGELFQFQRRTLDAGEVRRIGQPAEKTKSQADSSP
jgi:S1-C subfamily serine protease